MEVCTDVQKDSGIKQHATGSDSLKAGPEKPLYKAVKVKPKIWQWSPHNVGYFQILCICLGKLKASNRSVPRLCAWVL